MAARNDAIKRSARGHRVTFRETIMRYGRRYVIQNRSELVVKLSSSLPRRGEARDRYAFFIGSGFHPLQNTEDRGPRGTRRPFGRRPPAESPPPIRRLIFVSGLSGKPRKFARLEFAARRSTFDQKEPLNFARIGPRVPIKIKILLATSCLR